MKKLLVFTMLAMLIISGTCFSEVTKKVDAFDGKIVITSTISNHSIRPFRYIMYYHNNESVNALVFGRFENEWYFFKNDKVDIKFDNDINNIQQAKILDTDSELSKGGICISSCTIDLTPELIDKINNATSITFSIYYTNQPRTIYNVPKAVLDEWKQVINTK